MYYKIIYVRWLNAFGHKFNELESLIHEINNRSCQVSCDFLFKGEKPKRDFMKVGLLVDKNYIRKRFSADVYSWLDKDGKLHKGSNPVYTQYREAFVENRETCPYYGIVISNNLKESVRNRLIEIAKSNNLKVFTFYQLNW